MTFIPQGVDRVPVMAQNGEYIINKKAAKQVSLSALDYINKTGKLPEPVYFEEGGPVDGTPVTPVQSDNKKYVISIDSMTGKVTAEGIDENTGLRYELQGEEITVALVENLEQLNKTLQEQNLVFGDFQTTIPMPTKEQLVAMSKEDMQKYVKETLEKVEKEKIEKGQFVYTPSAEEIQIRDQIIAAQKEKKEAEKSLTEAQTESDKKKFETLIKNYNKKIENLLKEFSVATQTNDWIRGVQVASAVSELEKRAEIQRTQTTAEANQSRQITPPATASAAPTGTPPATASAAPTGTPPATATPATATGTPPETASAAPTASPTASTAPTGTPPETASAAPTASTAPTGTPPATATPATATGTPPETASAAPTASTAPTGTPPVTNEATKTSIEEQVKTFEADAMKGDVNSMYNAGIAYYEGKGVPKNLDKAKIYFEMAKRNGDKDSDYWLTEIEKQISGGNATTSDGLPQHLSAVNIGKLFDEKESAAREYERAQKELENIKKTKGEGSEEYLKQSSRVRDLRKTSEKKKEELDYAVDMRRTLISADEHIESARKTAEESARKTAEFRRSVGLPEDSGPIEQDTRSFEEIMESVHRLRRNTPTGFEATMPPEAAILEEDKRITPGTGWVTALTDASTSVHPTTSMSSIHHVGQVIASSADSAIYGQTPPSSPQFQAIPEWNSKEKPIATALLEVTLDRLEQMAKQNNTQGMVVNNSPTTINDTSSGGGGGDFSEVQNTKRFTSGEEATLARLTGDYMKGAVV